MVQAALDEVGGCSASGGGSSTAGSCSSSDGVRPTGHGDSLRAAAGAESDGGDELAPPRAPRPLRPPKAQEDGGKEAVDRDMSPRTEHLEQHRRLGPMTDAEEEDDEDEEEEDGAASGSGAPWTDDEGSSTISQMGEYKPLLANIRPDHEDLIDNGPERPSSTPPKRLERGPSSIIVSSGAAADGACDHDRRRRCALRSEPIAAKGLGAWFTAGGPLRHRPRQVHGDLSSYAPHAEHARPRMRALPHRARHQHR